MAASVLCMYFSMENHNSRQDILILFWKYLVDIRSEAWLNLFWEYINGKLVAVQLIKYRATSPFWEQNIKSPLSSKNSVGNFAFFVWKYLASE
jgi:hypothetical protein